MEKTQLRFAPLVRVSTEGQERQGESLRTQRAEIERAVKALGGTLIDDPWRYSGQEHATVAYERKKLDALLADAAKGLFDAVIVCDASRWSRDNGKSKIGLETLRQNGIRFYAGQGEYDLYKPSDTLFLGMATEINEFVALENTRKSIQNRIARAQRNVPTSGKLPYGRTFDRGTGAWGVDEEKQRKIIWAAERYLSGDKMKDLAKALNMNHTNLWKILTTKSGDTWETRYRSKRLDIDEVVTLTVPRLLPQATIDKIKKRAAGNKTYHHGEPVHQYLLSRVVICAECGYLMFGQTNLHSKQNRYYRHPRDRVTQCDPSFWVRADDLEQVVFMHLFALCGDSAGLEAAMARAIPDADKVDGLLAQKAEFERELAQVIAGKDKVVEAIAKGIISDADVVAQMTALKERQAAIGKAIADIETLTKGVPTRKQIAAQAKLAKRMLSSTFSRPGRIAKMSFADKRKLIETFFDGQDAEGKRLGVYVRKTEQGVEYTIRGALGAFEGMLEPDGMDPVALAQKMGLSIQYAGDLLRAISGLSQRHAYYCKCFHQRR